MKISLRDLFRRQPREPRLLQVSDLGAIPVGRRIIRKALTPEGFECLIAPQRGCPFCGHPGFYAPVLTRHRSAEDYNIGSFQCDECQESCTVTEYFFLLQAMEESEPKDLKAFTQSFLFLHRSSEGEL